MTTPSRRQIILGLAATTAVIGFDPIHARWVSTAHAQAASSHPGAVLAQFHHRPPLQGTLHLDDATRDACALDQAACRNEVGLTP
jgi:hypothetical protein